MCEIHIYRLIHVLFLIAGSVSSSPYPHLIDTGTTLTVILVTGFLLSVANIGDSMAVLDTGCSMLQV